MLYLMVEEGYTHFPWFQRSLRSIYNASRKKRISIQRIDRVDQVSPSNQDAGVLLLGATESWFNRQMTAVNAIGACPISMTNRGDAVTDKPYSSVSMDLRDSLRLAVDYLHSIGRKKLAIYGVNPYSSSDPWRAEIFVRATGREKDVYYNRVNLAELFAQFQPHVKEYDGVICVNDYAAVSLSRHLQAIGVDPTRELYIVGGGNMNLTQLCKPSITSISDDYEHFGDAAISIYQMAVKEKTILSVKVLMHSCLHIRETTGNEPYAPKKQSPVPISTPDYNPFYQDEEVAEMARLEWMHHLCDDTDLLLLDHLLKENLSYAELADQCFISVTAAKYRMKKIEGLCGVQSRAELRNFLKKYISL